MCYEFQLLLRHLGVCFGVMHCFARRSSEFPLLVQETLCTTNRQDYQGRICAAGVKIVMLACVFSN
jgi:hypothetical protein